MNNKAKKAAVKQFNAGTQPAAIPTFVDVRTIDAQIKKMDAIVAVANAVQTLCKAIEASSVQVSISNCRVDCHEQGGTGFRIG